MSARTRVVGRRWFDEAPHTLVHRRLAFDERWRLMNEEQRQEFMQDEAHREEMGRIGWMILGMPTRAVYIVTDA